MASSTLDSTSPSTIVYGAYPVHSFWVDFQERHLVGRVDGLDAIMQHIRFLLTVERYKYPVFTKNVGVDLDSLVGRDADLIRCILPARVRDALLVDPRVLDVTNFQFEVNGSDVLARFKVTTIYGVGAAEVSVTGG
jgi:hypothetical protein